MLTRGCIELAVGAALALVACRGDAGSGSHGEEIVLTDNTLWQEVDPATDPLASHRPDPVECALDARRLEGGILEMSMIACNYFALQQPLLESVRAGDQLHIVAWHLNLWAEQPAEGHLAVLIDGDVVWEITVPIPHEPESYFPTWIAERDYPKGSRVVLHLHNHGINTWKFLELTCAPPP